MPEASSPVRRTWRTRAVRYGLFVLALLCVPVGYLLYTTYSADAELRRAEEEAARLDPNWRLDGRSKRSIPEEKNPTLGVQATLVLLPGGWFNKAVFEDLKRPAPQYRLPDATRETLKTELTALSPALIEARKLAGMTLVSDVAVPPNFSNPGGMNEVRSVASLLDYDALLRSQEGDIDGALTNGQGMINAQRAAREQPSAMRFFVSLAIRQIAMNAFEHALAQGQALPASLEATQKLLEAEAGDGLLVQSLRGERIGSYLRFWELRESFIAGYIHAPAHISLLKLHTQAIEHAKSLAHEHKRLFAEWDAQVKSAPPLAKLAGTSLSKAVDANLRTEARLRCTIAAFAAERFRLSEKRWPNTLEELVAAKVLKEVPLDPYTGQPLRLRPTNDGLVIHSVGPDQKYAGDGLDNPVIPPETPRYEFRLWNVDRRAQPPPMAKP